MGSVGLVPGNFSTTKRIEIEMGPLEIGPAPVRRLDVSCMADIRLRHEFQIVSLAKICQQAGNKRVGDRGPGLLVRGIIVAHGKCLAA